VIENSHCNNQTATVRQQSDNSQITVKSSIDWAVSYRGPRLYQRSKQNCANDRRKTLSAIEARLCKRSTTHQKQEIESVNYTVDREHGFPVLPEDVEANVTLQIQIGMKHLHITRDMQLQGTLRQCKMGYDACHVYTVYDDIQYTVYSI
jgi:hypothetical protein